MKGVTLSMDFIIPISVGVIAVAFCILVYYLVTTLKTFSQSLNQITETVNRLEGKVEDVTVETNDLLKKVNALADDLQEKSEKLNAIVDSSQEVAKTIHKFNDSLGDISDSIIHKVRSHQDKMAQIIQWGNIIIELKEKWDELKKRKMGNDENKKYMQIKHKGDS